MKAIIEVDVPDFQIGQEVSIYFKDTMMKKAIEQEPKIDMLDKIRAEIEALEDKMLNLPNDWRTSEVFENVLDIIDKYIGGEE